MLPGTAATCRFHPDAKAFAFGSGRFDFGYTSLWDTPHDMWFCCGSSEAACVGCVEEAQHVPDPSWWMRYAHLAPPLITSDADDEDNEDEDEDEEEEDEDEDLVNDEQSGEEEEERSRRGGASGECEAGKDDAMDLS
mmetsp:Transcript_25413/g.60459  ORF Transcript_25413/g.60459 Transcript_25413/m.60459 type:complete len:137 (+) Transcript_25413:268-678(+)|eukprot:CAMPEP_0177737618 /NCGR_PEP_ID=MMETSP0484_2-20121128/25985_1 /TAXON_ID=354590 /ORGANISM="Rhodomonas lens, Strain RHODO" /LENGTH=136 /DNA_ID=CAMNT_0019251419 /DNA_START=36 /DNA_END=446 /DNA_ORIENTATION=-